MYFLDRQRGADGAHIYKVKQNFDYPLQRNKDGSYKIKSGEQIRVCMTSDFFLPEADEWRAETWEIMRKRPDVVFFLLTKRPERVAACLPKNRGDGWENIFFNVTAENQRRADERLPLLLELPFKHKGVMTAPFIGEISLAKYLVSGQIEQVIAGGENYDGARPLDYDWVLKMSAECRQFDVTFCFFETGTCFIKDGKTYTLPDKRLQSRMAYRSGISHLGRKVDFKLSRPQADLFEYETYVPYFGRQCEECGFRLLCNGCSRCGKCGAEK